MCIRDRIEWLPAFRPHPIPTQTIGYEYMPTTGRVNVGCPRCSESDSWPKPVGGQTKSTAPSRSRTASACSSVRSSAWIEAPPRFYGSGPRQWRPDAPARNVNARHAALGELVAAWIARQLGWIVAAEVSFAIYGERGIIDRL